MGGWGVHGIGTDFFDVSMWLRFSYFLSFSVLGRRGSGVVWCSNAPPQLTHPSSSYIELHHHHSGSSFLLVFFGSDLFSLLLNIRPV